MIQSIPSEETTSRFIDLEGVKVHYNEAGQGQTIIFIHGSGPGASGWSNFSQNLKVMHENFHVIAIDCPGWGKSDTPSDEQSNLVEIVRKLMDALDVSRAALVGNSMGGAVATAFAIEYPDRISHLVTMGAPCPGPKLFSDRLESEGLKILFATYSDPSPENFKRLVETMCFDSAFATDDLVADRSAAALANREHLRKFLKPNNMATLVPGFMNLGARIAEIKTPTLAIHGRNDRTVHYENSLQLVSMVPDSRLVLMNRCGHWVQLEHSTEFNQLVSNFVSSQ